jgi:nitrogen-specific signal transduction histidine kinase
MTETALLAELAHRLAHLLDRLEHFLDQRAPERSWHALGGWWPPHTERW